MDNPKNVNLVCGILHTKHMHNVYIGRAIIITLLNIKIKLYYQPIGAMCVFAIALYQGSQLLSVWKDYLLKSKTLMYINLNTTSLGKELPFGN